MAGYRQPSFRSQARASNPEFPPRAGQRPVPFKPHWTREGAIRGPFKLGDSERGQSRSVSKLYGAVSEAP